MSSGGTGVSPLTPKCRSKAFSAMVDGSKWLSELLVGWLVGALPFICRKEADADADADDEGDAKSAESDEKRLDDKSDEVSSMSIISL